VNKLWGVVAVAICLAIWGGSAGAIEDPAGSVGQEAAGTTEGVARQLLVMLRTPLPHFRPENAYSGRYTDDAGHRARRRIAEAIARSHDLKVVSDWPMPLLRLDCFVMEASSIDSVGAVAEILSRDPHVEWVQRMSEYRVLGAGDPLYTLQPSARYWHLAELHGATTGRDVRVAIIDSGVDDRHPDLQGQVRLKENFVDGNPYVPESHGTAVAGIIGASAGNGVGIEGVASNAQLMALRACWEGAHGETTCNSFTLGKALNFAIMRKARVINLSVAGPSDRLLQLLLDAALAQGIVVVVAVDRHDPTGGFPASHAGVLAVADEDGDAVGNDVWMAPGRDVPTTAPGGRWSFVSGASYACAHVSGMVALLVQLHASFSPTQIRQELITYPASSNLGRTPGKIDACATISKSVGTCICSCSPVQVSNVTR
jgi:subtilisin family serine protease